MKKALILTIIIIIAALLLVLGIRFFSGPEDYWYCENGEWLKHGKPDSAMPKSPCEGIIDEEDEGDELDKEETNNNQQYNWSTMNQGPYRDKISFAESTDLLSWTDSEKILAEHASVPGAIYKDEVIYVYFVDVSEDGVPEKIGLIKSVDQGQNWSEKEPVTIAGLGEKVAVDPAPFLLADGRVRLYYFDIEEERSGLTNSTNKIYSAVSTDGINFNEEAGVRFARAGIFDPDVNEANGVWRMYVGDINGNKVISAISNDGLNFTEEGIAFTGGAVPDVFKKENSYYLFTAGINIANSKNGQEFTKTNNSFQSTLGNVTADPAVIKISEEKYLMFFKTKSDNAAN